MKTVKSFLLCLLLVGFAACQTIEEPNGDANSEIVPEVLPTPNPETKPETKPEENPNTPPTAHLKFVGTWDFDYMLEASVPFLKMDIAFLQTAGFPVKAITLIIEKNATFKVNGIATKNLEGTYAIQGEDLLMTFLQHPTNKYKSNLLLTNLPPNIALKKEQRR